MDPNLKPPRPAPPRSGLQAPLLLLGAFLFHTLSFPSCQAAEPSFRAGASITDISPTLLPVIVNGMFTERTATQVTDPLEVRSLALDDGAHRVVIAVVDTCMLPRDLIDQAKIQVHAATGIPADQLLVSATHTHSAPAAMGCLGSRVDPRYAATLPTLIAQGMIEAVRQLVPAEVGWSSVDAWNHTFCRRWIRRPDRLIQDPFGQKSARAHMHPGHQSPDAIGPSGPVDPELSLLAVRHTDGRPLALLANFSQHYYGSPLLSSDYFGRFARHFANRMGALPDSGFVVMMSQGTSGDAMWMDYAQPARDIGYDAYARELVELALPAWEKIVYLPHAPIAMREALLDLAFRVPDVARLEWARPLVEAQKDRLPTTLPEVYALETLHLLSRPRAELKLQALRIGDLALTALPNEVYALTGLKLKAQSPFPHTFNVSLANGAEGYIPPPEQHALGGYTTWPARTAGLEVQAEPRIVETLLTLLEDLAGHPRRNPVEIHGPYPQAILQLQPAAYWRLGDWTTLQALDSSPHAQHARFDGPVALRLPGPDLPRPADTPPNAPPLTPNPFSGPDINSAVHFAGGRLIADDPLLKPPFTTIFWFWNGLDPQARAVTGHLLSLLSRPPNSATLETLAIGGTNQHPGHLIFHSPNVPAVTGPTPLSHRSWHWLAMVRHTNRLSVFLDGRPEIDAPIDLPFSMPSTWMFGADPNRTASLEGRLDEIAVFDRALEPAELHQLYQTAILPPSTIPDRQDSPPTSPPLEPPPTPPEQALQRLQLRPGFTAELVAAEPLIQSPVALDWDPQGRLWVVEMIDYPLGLEPDGRPGGQIRLLQDTNADGRYDHSTVFADNLPFPTGIMSWREGVLVTAAPAILFLQDRDGDGRADHQETLFSGFLEGNQQLRVNGLRWGLDNWIHGASGSHHAGYGRDTRVQLHSRHTSLHLGSRDFRFRPDSGEFVPQSGPSQFGRDREDFGDWFGEQNSWPIWHYVLEDQDLRRNPHIPTPQTFHRLITPANPRVYPASTQEKRFHSFTDAGHFTSACAVHIYRDTLLFPDTATLHSFTCEPFHNLVHHALLTPSDVSYQARRDPVEAHSEFLRSDDRWFRPVMTRTGPDGALWVVDMYRYMIEHPEWLPEEGRQELLPHYRAGEERGRIYRIFPSHQRPGPIPRLGPLSTPELVAQLRSPNGWIRDQAQQQLLHRRDPDALPLLHSLTRHPQPLARLHARATLDGLNQLTTDPLLHGLADPHPRLRAHALRLAQTRPTPAVLQAALRLADDPHPRVQLQLAVSLGSWTGPDIGRTLARLLHTHRSHEVLRAAALSSVLPHLAAVTAYLAPLPPDEQRPLIAPLLQSAIGTHQFREAGRLLQQAMDLPSPEQGPLSSTQLLRLADLLDHLDQSDINLPSLAANPNDLGSTIQALQPHLATARLTAENPTAPEAIRIAALSLFARHPQAQPDVTRLARQWLEPRSSPALQQAALRTLTRSADPAVADLLLEAWPSLPPQTRHLALDELTRRESWTLALLARVEDGRLTRNVFDADRRARLLRHPSPAVRHRAESLLSQPDAPTRSTVLEQFRPALHLEGSSLRGHELYTRLCASCHRLGNEGREVGPDLLAVAGNSNERLLQSILDPNAVVLPGFEAYQVALDDGEELDGLIAGDTGPSLLLRLSDGATRSLDRQRIQSLHTSGVSLMPEGLEEGLTPQDLADLIAVIQNATDAHP
jgi:putative membrane-bound dehydrogenase-like protein